MSELKSKFKNFIRSLKQNGLKTEIRRVYNYVKYKKTILDEYDEWILLNEPNEKQLNEQRNYKSLLNTKFLIIVSNEEEAKRIGNQTYSNFEVIISSPSEYLKNIENYKGNYCVFKGDNIELQPFCLYSIARFVDSNECNIAYSDNDWIKDGKRQNPDFKPHFAYHNILSKNYIGNLVVCKKAFLKENKALFENLSSKEPYYDIVLRAMTLSKTMHIEEVLYHKLDEKIDCEEQKILIKNYLDRAGFKYDDVKDGKFLGQYKVDYSLLDNEKISIVIPNMDHKEDLEKCVNSILKSSYQNYEIVIVENNSKNQETFEYYQKLENEHNNVKIIKLEINEFNYSKIVNFGVKEASRKIHSLIKQRYRSSNPRLA